MYMYRTACGLPAREPLPKSRRDLGEVLQLVAAWHLVTIPLGPLLAAVQHLTGEPGSVIWLVFAPISSSINYRLN